MSLLDEYMAEFTHLRGVSTPDGYGGTKVVYSVVDVISGALAMENTGVVSEAMSDGVSNDYTFTTTKNSTTLLYGDVLQRASDNKCFYVTSNSSDKQTPSSSSLNLQQVKAKDWKMPDE